MFTAISTALSGLNANAGAINVIGNDLANLNTTGYKANQLHFEDLIAEQLGTSGTSGQLGLGVGQVSAVRNFTQGATQTTNGATDAAIQGDGFFVLKDPNTAQTLYTRDGSFQLNSGGQLMTNTGQMVQGWSAVKGVVDTNGAIGGLTLPLGQTVPATATTAMSLGLNLDSRVAVTVPPTAVTAPILVYDSQGQTHNLTATFTKTGANSWSYAVSIPPADLVSGSVAPVTSGTLTFDNNGNLATPLVTTDPQQFSVTGLTDGASDLKINWSMYDSAGNSKITQYAESSSINAASQDGYAAGAVSKVSLQNGGTVVASYTNGQQSVVGQIALASITNPSSLSAVGNNNLQATASTGVPVIGAAGTGGRGHIVAGALESSTVDIATEFAQLLTFQRGYQADSRVITTSDQLTQETVNLIHA